MGPDLAGSFAETSGACLCPNSVTQLCSGLQLLGTCWVWLTPVPLCLHLALGSPGPGFPMFLELPVRQSLDSIPTTHTQREAEGPQSHRVRAREKEMQAGFPSKSQLHLTGKDNTL